MPKKQSQEEDEVDIEDIPTTVNEIWQGPNPFHTQQDQSAATSTITRIAFQNLNGLRKYTETIKDSVTDLYHTIQNYSVDVLCISEHHLPTQHQATRYQLQQTVRTAASKGCLHIQIDSSDYPPSSTNRLIGGTGIFNTRQTIGRMTQNGHGGDSMGRWSYCKYTRPGRPNLIIISIYQVCNQPTNKIGHTAWHQQRCQLDRQKRSTEHPREAFRRDLETFLEEQQSLNNEIIIGGDWNDYIESARSTILRICTKFNLIDPWIARYPHHDSFPTHARGQNRIDAVLVSTTLIEAITNICYTPVGYLAHSDHRGLVVDFSTKKLFTKKRDEPESYLPRLVRSKDLQSVKTFIEAWYQALLDSEAAQLSAHIRYSTEATPETIQMVEALDEVLGQTGHQSEQRCMKRRSTWYSKALVKTRNEIKALKYHRNGMKRQRNMTPITQVKLDNLSSTIQLPTTLKAMNKLIDEKINELNDIRKRSLEVRINEVDSMNLVPNQTKKRNKDPRTKINRAEVAGKTWRTLNSLSGTHKTQTIQRIDVPSDWTEHSTEPDESLALSDPKLATKWEEIHDADQIEYYLLLRNRKHFGQAHGTPFTTPGLKESIDWGGTSETVKMILEGQYILPSSYTQACQVLIHQCRVRYEQDHHDNNGAELTLNEFKGKITKWRETTTTSPSGRHLGWYRSLFKTGIYRPSTSDEAKEFEDKQQMIIEIILQISNFCIRTGYVLSRWRNVTNMMLLKDENNYKIHRMRIIHLYEADLNLIFAVKWRKLMHQADNKQLINPSQYGSRPGHEATTLALMEELKNDISYLSRRTLLTFDNDAASCYDRIIPSLASLIHRKYGLHPNLTKLHGSMLHSAEYKLRTPNGLSTNGYRHNEMFPIYGTGQGSGNSPIIWLLISATLFDCYDEKSHGAQFTTPNNELSTRIHISGFVDDTNISMNMWKPQHQPPLETMIPQLTSDAQWWNDLLFTSGGKLELSKCSFHALEFLFQPNGIPYVKGAQKATIKLLDSETSAPIGIPMLTVASPHKTLGHWKAPSGKGTTQLNHLKMKAKQLSTIISTSPIPRSGAKLAYYAKYIATLRYILPQCHFSHKCLHQAEKKSIGPIISKCGFSSRSPHAILFTPTSLGGGGFIHWSSLQSIGQIMHFIKHWRSETQPSMLLRIGMAWAQWQAGTRRSLLRDTRPKFNYLEARWIQSLREALRSCHATLRLHQNFVQKSERLGDKFIMNIAIRIRCFTNEELHILNCCRLYLHVTTTSELFNVAGTKLLKHMTQGYRPRWFNPETVTTIQQRPSQYQWRTIWTRFCDIIQPTGATLGPFVNRTIPWRLRREAYIETNTLYYWYGGSYWITAPTQVPNQYELIAATTWNPQAQSIPIDVIARIRMLIYCDESSHAQTQPILSTTPLNPIAETFGEYVSQLSQTYRRLLDTVQWITPPYQSFSYIQESTQNQPLLIVSDGSMSPNNSMSFGVVIGTSAGRILCECQGPADGSLSSHRAECTGCLVGGIVLTHLLQFISEASPSLFHVQVLSDNQAMITSLTARWKYTEEFTNNTLRSDWDLLEEITSVYRELNPSTLSFEWVQGHQDRGLPRSSSPKVQDTLSTKACYNIRADALANEYQNQDPKRHHFWTTPLYHATKCHLDIEGRTVHGKFFETILRAISQPAYTNYLTNKHKWDHATYLAVDWEAFAMASRTYFSTEVHLTKLIHNLLPTKDRISKYKPWVSPRCQHCDHNETFYHLQICPNHPGSRLFRRTVMANTLGYFHDHKIPQSFRVQFLTALQESLGLLAENVPDRGFRGSDAALQSQRKVGIHLLTRGFFTIEWRTLLQRSIYAARQQQTFLATHPNPYRRDSKNVIPESTFEPTKFLAGLIKILWGELGSLWLNHLSLLHQPSGVHLTQSRETRTQLESQFRLLHNLHPYLSAEQKEAYVPATPTRFVQEATDEQLRRYLDVYQPMITTSVRNAYDATRGHSSQTASQFLREKLTWQPPPSESPDFLGIPLPHPAQSQSSHRTRNRLKHPDFAPPT